MRIPHRVAGVAAPLLALSLLASCSDDTVPDPVADDAISDATQASDPTSATAGGDTSGGASGSATATAPADDGKAVPVYYVGDSPGGDVLFREFTRASGLDPLVASAAGVTQGDPVDPDYRSLWPGGRFASVTQTADAFVVELPDETWTKAGSLDAGQRALAVQQLVYSLQGTAGKRLPVLAEYDGKPVATLLGVKVGAGLKAAPELDVLGLVNITEPAEGTAVSGRFTASGRASSFEGTVIWEIRDAADKVVQQGWANATGWDKLYPWRKSINVSKLAPGHYTFVAHTDDPSSGEGPGPTEDTKRITVQ